LHCSRTSQRRKCALFFGYRGTGKTTIAADPERKLIGDDEKASDGGYSILKAGLCKIIILSHEHEPRYGTQSNSALLVGNVILDEETGVLDSMTDAD
jgi:phosphoenolpyruvate carboxykinase (ATP)